MNLNYNRDKKILLNRSFYMHKKCVDVLKQLYVLLTTASYKDFHLMLYTLKEWLLSPLTIWPNDWRGAAEFVCQEFKAGRGIDREMAALLEFSKPVPGKKEQDAIAEYEVEVEVGNYEQLVKDDVKYPARMKELNESRQFHAHFDLLKSLYNFDEIANGSTVLRRMMVCERNFRIRDFFFDWSSKKSRFYNVFTAFCTNHELYGLEKVDGKWVPLLMKVTVNVTPQGQIIFVPKWMSFDLKRDLVIKAITDLHKCRGALRQGEKISESRLEKEELARTVYLEDVKIKKDGIKGPKRFELIRAAAGLPPGFDARRIRELIRQGAEVVAAEKELESIAAAIASLPAARDTEPTALETALHAFAKLSPEDKDKFLKAVAVK